MAKRRHSSSDLCLWRDVIQWMRIQTSQTLVQEYLVNNGSKFQSVKEVNWRRCRK